jgi:hypothetical protein
MREWPPSARGTQGQRGGEAKRERKYLGDCEPPCHDDEITGTAREAAKRASPPPASVGHAHDVSSLSLGSFLRREEEEKVWVWAGPLTIMKAQ